MKHLTVMAAGLGWELLERHSVKRMAGLAFEPAPGVFPAVTCVAQATLRTGRKPAEHGMIANGWWNETLKKPLFWEQSAALVKGERVWSARRAAGGSVGLFFFQQSLGEEADVIVSPAPIHKHGGGMAMSCYVKPTALAAELERVCGTFPLWRYWGPLASPKVGRACVSWFRETLARCDVDEAYLYLPTLDYAAQKYGPGTRQEEVAFSEFRRQLEDVADICQRCGAGLAVTGDYAIAPVTKAPVMPNVVLRQAGLFQTRTVGGRVYPDFYQSAAFAMCDHEFCVVYGPERDKAVTLLQSELRLHPSSLSDHSALLLAPEGSWCAYPWWTNRREAPDFAAHVDIHNKPGYDPTELFFFGRGVVKGTHGRSRPVAQS